MKEEGGEKGHITPPPPPPPTPQKQLLSKSPALLGSSIIISHIFLWNFIEINQVLFFSL